MVLELELGCDRSCRRRDGRRHRGSRGRAPPAPDPIASDSARRGDGYQPICRWAGPRFEWRVSHLALGLGISGAVSGAISLTGPPAVGGVPRGGATAALAQHAARLVHEQQPVRERPAGRRRPASHRDCRLLAEHDLPARLPLRCAVDAHLARDDEGARLRLLHAEEARDVRVEAHHPCAWTSSAELAKLLSTGSRRCFDRFDPAKQTDNRRPDV